MTWLKLGDEFSKECRRARISDSAFRLHVEGLCFAMDDENGGVIYADDIQSFARARNPIACAEELERAGFWERTSETSWQIVNQMNHQPSVEVLTARRDADAKRQERKRRKAAGLDAESGSLSRRDTPRDSRRDVTRDTPRDDPRDTPRDDPRDPVRFGPVLDGAGQEKALEVSTTRGDTTTHPGGSSSPACGWCGGKGDPDGCPQCGQIGRGDER